MSQEYLRDEEALSTEEINRVKTKRKYLLKKSLVIFAGLCIVGSFFYLMSVMNVKKKIHDRKEAKKASLVAIDRNLSPDFGDDEF